MLGQTYCQECVPDLGNQSSKVIIHTNLHLTFRIFGGWRVADWACWNVNISRFFRSSQHVSGWYFSECSQTSVEDVGSHISFQKPIFENDPGQPDKAFLYYENDTLLKTSCGRTPHKIHAIGHGVSLNIVPYFPGNGCCIISSTNLPRSIILFIKGHS